MQKLLFGLSKLPEKNIYEPLTGSTNIQMKTSISSLFNWNFGKLEIHLMPQSFSSSHNQTIGQES
jgi:hypothetical protein